MKLEFDEAVRKSIAEELKKVSTFGGVALGILGYTNNSFAVFFGAFVWWAVCQTMAHVLVALKDD